MNNYSFASGDLLSNPNTYFYTEYKGVDFFDYWKDSRRRAIPTEIVPQPPVKSAVVYSIAVLQEKLNGGAVDAFYIFDSLYEWIKNRSEEDESGFNLINQLVKRFEVTKRVYSSYSGSMNPSNKEQFNDFALYLRIAEVFEVGYDHFGIIQYLNVLIKVIDTLSAFSNKLNISGQARLSMLLIKEKKHICRLAESVGLIL